MKIKLGTEVEDKITGFVGIAVAKVEYLTGCIRYEVSPKVDKDGKFQDSIMLDEQRLKVIKQEKTDIKAKRTGGPTARVSPQKGFM